MLTNLKLIIKNLCKKNSTKVIVCSQNPVKINAIKLGFEKVFPDTVFEFVGVSAKSEVSDQPMSEKETYLGALNRVKNAKLHSPDADFWAGIEGGLEEIDGKLEAFAFIIIESKNLLGKSKTATFELPNKVAELIHSGMELGDADDVVFGGNNSKQKNGSVGILTKNLITRTSYYTEAVVLALIPFINKELY